MQLKKWIGCIAIGVLLAGCPDDDEPGEVVEDDIVDAESAADASEDDTEGADGPDGAAPDGNPDFGTPGPGADVQHQDGDGPMCGGFGDPCLANAECCSEWCVETFDGFQCTQTCFEDCPEGWECKAVINTFPDVATICVPNVSKLCKPCEIDLQCNGGKCADIAGQNFCTIGCSEDDPCPDGFSCTEDAEGAPVCLPSNGTCDCTPAKAGIVRPCAIDNDFGTCAGIQTCEPAIGWTPCDAGEASDEICDGLDNDCDGLADEDFLDPVPCTNDNDFGTCLGIATCQGPVGVVCSAKSPTAEACDFLDNDCDNTVDEDFKDATGKYGFSENCGGCGTSCVDLFPNATAKCDVTLAVPQCAVDTCDEGFYPANPFQCLPQLDVACQPCTADFQCGGGVCISVGGEGSFCAKGCAGGVGCEGGFLCLPGQDSEGNPKGQACQPSSGTCSCTPAQTGQKRPCTNESELGKCFGFESCDPAFGWVGCDAAIPAPEVCDGGDNDCNGLVDDGLASAQACESVWPGIGSCPGEESCQGTQGWVCNAPTPTAELCDFVDNDCDGETDEIFKNEAGKYAGQAHCGTCGATCDGAIPNAVAVCDETQGNPTCVVESCSEGFFEVSGFLCLPLGQSHCSPCTTDANCDGRDCVDVDGGLFCTDPCTEDTDCPAGFTCSQTPDPDTGALGDFCIPANKSCDCIEQTAGAKKPCQATNELGSCIGFRTCDPSVGWSTCSTTGPELEACDGLDNDCNGLIDDGLPGTQDCDQTNEFGTCSGTSTCNASQGWVCNASAAAAETCDFQDNDCDGGIDEDYKNDAGKYGSDEHCGSCNNACGTTIANSATETCDATKANPLCIATGCAEGFFLLNDFQCIVPPDVVCNPCETDEQCFDGICTQMTDGKACLAKCTDDGQCPDGFACDGLGCIPESGSCDCTQATAGAKQLCSQENEFGTCVGFKTCDPASGWSLCDAGLPGVEVCDGADNDCNGIPDDALPASQPCQKENDQGLCTGDEVCQGAIGWVCQAPEPSFELCDFTDNDCDGGIDEDFKDPQGKYSSAFHCGTCGQACGNTIANSAVEACDSSKDVPNCVALQCENGFFLQNELSCVPNPAVGCTPCVADDTCYGGSCVPVGSGNFCLEPCSQGCKTGFGCQDGLCHPNNDSCDCSDATAGATRTCTVTNDLGVCLGFETCDPAVGWGGCTADTAAEEICDGLDNDCNGLIDNGLPTSQVCFEKNTFGTCAGLAKCFGSAGWICDAPTPDAEACDFVDNDCDGGTDEDYKDAGGKYSTLTHCGTCDNTCGDQYVNSLSESCDASQAIPQCIVNECEDGFLKLNDFQCLEIPEVNCQACSSDGNCFGSSCVQVDLGDYCLPECAEAADCPTGYFCSEGLCRPNNGTCDCSVDNAGDKRTCSITNGIGTCFGFEDCDPNLGWAGCDAVAPFDEICDGVDNDCNGFLDDGLPFFQLCENTNFFGTCPGKAVCFGSAGWLCQAPIPTPEQCDFIDNNCDGQADETFKDIDGKYSSQEHCGGCDINCDGAILNGTAFCDGTKPVPQCIVNDCDIGWEKFNDFLCVPIISALCEPCAEDANCVAEGAACVSLTDGLRCGIACDDDTECPTGFLCLPFAGVAEKQCVPATGSCDCDGTNTDLQQGCSIEFDPGDGGPISSCPGTRFCAVDGWTDCVVPVEQCNGVDDNCDGTADEGFKDETTGKYVSPLHCGKCNRNCATLTFNNAVGVCDTAPAEPDCTFNCNGGFFDVNANPADGCECEFKNGLDLPNGEDLNCDTVDGEVANAIFVAKNGDNANVGSLALPKLTIQAGIDAAVTLGKRDVYVATGVYSENVVLAAGVSVYGGYTGDFTQRDITLFETAVIGQEPGGAAVGAFSAFAIAGAGEPTNLDGFTVFGPDSQSAGDSSYAVWIRDCDARLQVTNNRIFSGSGGNGQSGGPGASGADGPDASGGADAVELCNNGAMVTAGGTAGVNTCSAIDTSGGAGGASYCNTTNATEDGGPGANGGGAGGVQGLDTIGVIGGLICVDADQSDGQPGGVGSPGAAGSTGLGCGTTAGTVAGGLWVAGLGTNGGAGTHGAGGGGGGGGGGSEIPGFFGAATEYNAGGSGGGGGAAGCLAIGGVGGTGGGGSFGVFMTWSAATATAPGVADNSIRRGNGGLGGPGGSGGVGGIGGQGGSGGAQGGACTRPGGVGGKGGSGGHGGGGGGGCGGSSYGLYAAGQGGLDLSTVKTGNTPLAGGTAGNGGPGGLSLGNGGQDGQDGAFEFSNF
ncbi:MAG: hypothetical protein ACI9WU_000730 [Myxococcota bacterium]|jgi:hypothetical protein